MSAEEIHISGDEITERFVRGDSSRNTEGSGLGLAIAKVLPKPRAANSTSRSTGICSKLSFVLGTGVL